MKITILKGLVPYALFMAESLCQVWEIEPTATAVRRHGKRAWIQMAKWHAGQELGLDVGASRNKDALGRKQRKKRFS